MEMIFKFKDGAHLRGDAQAVGERLELIRKQCGLTPEAVVDDARSSASVLHDYFEWDDAQAAHRFRLDQAGHLIRCVTVVIEEAPAQRPQAELLVDSTPAPEARALTVRAFLPVTTSGGRRVYESTEQALSDPAYRRQVLERAHSELGAVAQKYKELTELSEVVGAIDRVGDLLTGERLPDAG